MFQNFWLVNVLYKAYYRNSLRLKEIHEYMGKNNTDIANMWINIQECMHTF